MLKMELLDNKVFKDAFESISRIVDEVSCKVDGDGFRVSAIDRSHICFVSLDLKAECFDEFICDVPEELCVDTAELMKILKRAKANDVLCVSSEGNNLILEFKGDVNRTFKIKLIDMEYDTPQPPNIELPVNLTIESSLVKDALTDMALFSEKLYFIVDSDYLVVNAEGEFGDANFKYLHGADVNGEVKSSYSIDKLQDIFVASKFSDVVQMGLGVDMPVIFDFELATGDGNLKFLLAPRIENEED